MEGGGSGCGFSVVCLWLFVFCFCMCVCGFLGFVGLCLRGWLCDKTI